MSPQKVILKLSLAAALSLTACAKNPPKIEKPELKGTATVIRYQYKSKEITQICDQAIKRSEERLTALVGGVDKKRTFENTIVEFENIMAELGDTTGPATFMNYVSTDKGLREEAEACDNKVSQYSVGVMARRDIYQALLTAAKQTPKKSLSVEQARLSEKIITEFKRNGLALSDEKLKEVTDLKKRMAEIETKFASNLNANTDFEAYTGEELKGAPESFTSRLTKLPDGKFKVTTKSTDYMAFMENVQNSEARHRLALKYENRAAVENTKLIGEAIELRQKIAKLLGYKTWSDYRAEDRMAKDSKAIAKFLTGLKEKLAARNKKDLTALKKLKAELEPNDKKFHPWDGAFYSYQLKKKDFALDDEVIREYFPSEYVVDRMFDIYAKMLGVKFEQVKNADTWAPHVNLYEIRNSSDSSFVANFYTDFVPREGKYGHAAAFTLYPGRVINGKYRTPVSAIVANFTPPNADKPSLMTHDEVETLFHEFGHIMHQTLTKAPYATISGTSVARDFVEAPSQMLENWVWEPSVLKQISGHYKDTSKKLPDDLIKKMIKARDFNRGYFYTRQLLFGLFDQKLHTSTKPIDPTKTYYELYKELTTVDPLEGGHFPATFGHLMGGYDAGYYGYLWSEVFAEDMFTVFAKKGLVNPEVGGRYRSNILERGDSVKADDLLVAFLGRKPNNKAFFKRLGIK